MPTQEYPPYFCLCGRMGTRVCVCVWGGGERERESGVCVCVCVCARARAHISVISHHLSFERVVRQHPSQPLRSQVGQHQ